MTIAFYMNCVSTHQLPLAKEVAALVGADNFTYIYEGESEQAYQRAGVEGLKFKVQGLRYDDGRLRDDSREVLESAEILYTGLRDLELFERRAAKGLKTYYTSERWFKPIRGLPGWMKMLVPSYRKMVKRFVKWANKDPNARVLAIGPWAKKDFLRIGISLDKIVDWGYYVKPSDALPAEKSDGTLRLLWCGRLLGWKRVGDIVRAVGEHVGLKRVGVSGKKLESKVEVEDRKISLTIVGDGPEKERLMKMAEKINSFVHLHSSPSPIITFLPGQPADKIREIMRKHDTLIFASNAYEGWGAVVSEALEEGMNVIGTYECGAAPTLLPRERLFHCGDEKELARLIDAESRGALPPCSIGEWTAAKAAQRLLLI